MIRASSVLILLGLGASMAVAQQPLPNLKVDLDGKPVTVAPVMLELNLYLVPLRTAVEVLTNGRGKLRALPGKSFDILVDGQVKVRIPLNQREGQYVEVFGKQGPPTAVKQFRTSSSSARHLGSRRTSTGPSYR
jgi:hypothetical protein